MAARLTAARTATRFDSQEEGKIAMSIRNRLGISTTILVLACLIAAVPAMAKIQVGESFSIHLDSARDYAGSADGSLQLAWEHEIQQPGATYIAVHF